MIKYNSFNKQLQIIKVSLEFKIYKNQQILISFHDNKYNKQKKRIEDKFYKILKNKRLKKIEFIL